MKKCLICDNLVKQLKRKYCSNDCRKIGVTGSGNPNYKGGHITDSGYRKVRMPEHHRANRAGYVREHIIIAEQKYNIKITENMVVHHIDGNKLNNNPDNLLLIDSRSNHHKLHNETDFIRDELGRFTQK